MEVKGWRGLLGLHNPFEHAVPPLPGLGTRGHGEALSGASREPPPRWQLLSPWQPPISPAALAGRSPVRSVLREIRAPDACLGFS